MILLFCYQGWSPCSLAIQGDKGIQIVAIGEVEVTSEVIHIHNIRVGSGFRRVKILEEIVSSAELPCPTEEFKFVCQAMKSFVTWPIHLIFPKAEVQNFIIFRIIVHSYFTIVINFVFLLLY